MSWYAYINLTENLVLVVREHDVPPTPAPHKIELQADEFPDKGWTYAPGETPRFKPPVVPRVWTAYQFLLRFTERPRPFVTVKMAASLDGRIGTRTGESRWITGTAARARGHMLRARHDAILVGIGTALADDPELTCRIPGLEDMQPLRVVLDRSLRLPPSHRLARDATRWPTLVFAADGAAEERAVALRGCGVDVVRARAVDEGLDLAHCLGILAGRGVTRLLCEGGGRVAAALLAADLVDELVRFTGGVAIGGDGVPAIGALGLDRLAAAPRFRLERVEACGEGVVELWARSSDGTASASCSPA